MKITCQACAAKYTIADEKVLGKIVKIRCKKCGATIVINGSESGAEVGGSGDVEGHAASQQAAWTVNVGDGDQRTMTDAEVVAAYHSGVLNDETFCWKDGMPDWLPIREIAALHTQVAGRPSALAPEASDDDAATRIQEAPSFLLGSAAPSRLPGPGRPAPRAANAAYGAGNGSGAVHGASGPSSAARRAGARPPPAADLFGAAAQAGSEEDVMTSAPVGMPEAHEDPHKMMGERNESSVLFSINALTSKGGVVPPSPMTATSEASGLIDIRQLSAQIGIGGDKKKSRIEDIMNLAGGGAFAPSLAAPMLSAVPIDQFGAQSDGVMPARSRGKELVFLALGAGAFVVVAAVGVALMLTRHSSDESAETKAKPTASASAGETEPTDPAGARETARPSEAAQASAGTEAPSAAADGPKESPHHTEESAHHAEERAHHAEEPAHRAEEPAHHAAAAPAAVDTPFNMGEARARLAAIAGSVQTCKKGDASGTGRVVIVFAPNGGTQSATVTGPPFEGTPTGSCVAVRFRGARVPPFGGSAFSVSKSFSIN